MKYLLYCVFEKPQGVIISIPTPSEGPRVQVVEKQGLCIAFSEVTDIDPVSDIARAMHYHRVIESFFDQVTVIPFRFGTRLDAYADIERLLGTRAEHYRKTLGKLDCCAEMGIRAIMDENHVPSRPAGCSSGFPSPEASNQGKLYLADRQNHYTAQSLLAEMNERATDRFRNAFVGLFTDFRSEVSQGVAQQGKPAGVLLSVYFLVPKELLGRFRDAFAALMSEGSSRLLLSGPWPPYNFVLPGDSPFK